MNKKEFRKVKPKEVEKLLEALGYSRKQVGESTLRRWLGIREIPLETWDRLNSAGFREPLPAVDVSSKIAQKFEERHHLTAPESGAPAVNPKAQADSLTSFTIEELVEELELRGWNVTLKRKGGPE